MLYSRSLHSRLSELVQLLAGVQSEVASDAVEWIRIHRRDVTDPMDVVAESLLLIRDQAIPPVAPEPQATHEFDEDDPALIVLIDS